MVWCLHMVHLLLIGHQVPTESRRLWPVLRRDQEEADANERSFQEGWWGQGHTTGQGQSEPMSTLLYDCHNYIPVWLSQLHSCMIVTVSCMIVTIIFLYNCHNNSLLYDCHSHTLLYGCHGYNLLCHRHFLLYDRHYYSCVSLSLSHSYMIVTVTFSGIIVTISSSLTSPLLRDHE